MIRLLIAVGILTSLLFVACLSLIQARRQQSVTMAFGLLGDRGCPLPCWHDIRPGYTNIDDALTLLAADAWVGQITRQGQRIEWTWSGRQPPEISANQPGWLLIDNQAVSAVNIPVDVSMGDLYFLLGTPAWNSTNRSGGMAEVRLTYPGEYLALTIVTRCPTTRSVFWLARPAITLLSQRPSGINFDPEILTQSIAC